MSQISNNASADENQEDDRSPFELLPREIKEKILKLVVEEIEHFIVFKWFWRLKRVNKEFYSIMSSQYAQRHFPKWPCSMNFSDRCVDYPFNVFIEWPLCYTKIERNSILNDNGDDTTGDVPTTITPGNMGWKDLPNYMKNKPFDLVFMIIQISFPNRDAVPAMVEMANQTTGTIDLHMSIHYNTFMLFTGYRGSQDEVLYRLEEHLNAGKINIEYSESINKALLEMILDV